MLRSPLGLTFAAALVAIAGLASPLFSQEPVLAEKRVRTTTPFTGQVLLIQFKSGRTQAIKDPTLRTIGDRDFVVGVSYPNSVLDNTIAWIGAHDINNIIEFRVAADYERYLKDAIKYYDDLKKPQLPDINAPADPTVPPAKSTPPRIEPIPAVNSLPTGIFGYDKARDNVSTGQRPTLEGLDWLAMNGFKTVVFLHAPGEQTKVDRMQVEKRGMTFVAIEIDAKGLNRDAVDRFLKIQSGARHKVFVYDTDGSLTGAMWYLSFRFIDGDSDNTARTRANTLGQNETRESAAELWREVQRYVIATPPIVFPTAPAPK